MKPVGILLCYVLAAAAACGSALAAPQGSQGGGFTFLPKLSGDIVASKGRAKVGERIDVSINVLYDGGEEASIQVEERIELVDPQGKVTFAEERPRSLTLNNYSKRNVAITCASPGTYTLKATLTSQEGLRWQDQVTFSVIASAGGAKGNAKGPGYYKLVSKVVGKAPAPGVGPDGTISGSIGESSFSVQYRGTNGYECNADFNINWSVPPSVLRPGEPIELTISANGDVQGRDRKFLSVDALWAAEGATVIERKKAFVGYASDGNLYKSAEGKLRVSVGSGGKVVFVSGFFGMVWGSGGVWNPCVYTYQWVANEAPPTAPKAPTVLTGAAVESLSDSIKSREGIYYARDVELPYLGRSFKHRMWLNFQESNTKGQLKVSGQLDMEEKNGYAMSFRGTYYDSSHKILGSGTMSKGIPGKWTITIDGTSRSVNQTEVMLTMKSADGSVVRHARVILVKSKS